MSATEGMGRRNSTKARVAARTPGRLPSTTPAGTATATAMASPSAQAPIVAATSARNCGLAASPAARASTVEASGSTAGLMTPARPSASAASRKTRTPQTPRAQPGMLQPEAAGRAGRGLPGPLTALAPDVLAPIASSADQCSSSGWTSSRVFSRPPASIRSATRCSCAGTSVAG